MRQCDCDQFMRVMYEKSPMITIVMPRRVNYSMHRHALTTVQLVIAIVAVVLVAGIAAFFISVPSSVLPSKPITVPQVVAPPSPQPPVAPKQVSNNNEAQAQYERFRAEREAKKAADEELARKLDAIALAEKTSLQDSCSVIAKQVRDFGALVTNPPEHNKAALDQRRAAAVSLQSEIDVLQGRLSKYSDTLKTKFLEAGASTTKAESETISAGLDASVMMRRASTKMISEMCGLVIKECDQLGGAMNAWRVKDGEIETDDISVGGRLRAPRVHLEGLLSQLEPTVQNLTK